MNRPIGNCFEPRTYNRACVAFLFVVFTAFLVAAACTGCAINSPTLTESTVVKDGATNTVKSLRVRSYALWPATQDIAKQKSSMSKATLSVGTEGLHEEGGGTNMVESLKQLNLILDKISPK